MRSGLWDLRDLARDTAIDPVLEPSPLVGHKLCTHHKSESESMSVLGSKQMAIQWDFTHLFWGGKTDLGDY